MQENYPESYKSRLPPMINQPVYHQGIQPQNPHTKNQNQPKFVQNPCKIKAPAHISNYSQKQSMEQIFKTLFGSNNVSDWPHSEFSLQKALDLRIQQEKTKQEFYEIERLNKIVELLKLAAVTKIPAHLIPSLINTSEPSPKFIPTPVTTPISSENNALRGNYSPDNSPSPIRIGHQRSKTISSFTDLQYTSNTNKQYCENKSPNTNPMKNFKFGLGSTVLKASLSTNGVKKNRSTLPPKHQLSPSRIGARAVSSLNRNTVLPPPSLMDLKHGKRHQRTLSLPSTVTIPETKPMVFHTHTHTKKASFSKTSTFREIIIPEFNVNPPSHREEDVERILNGDQNYKLVQNNGGKSPLREMTTSDEMGLTASNSSLPTVLTIDPVASGSTVEPKTP